MRRLYSRDRSKESTGRGHSETLDTPDLKGHFQLSQVCLKGEATTGNKENTQTIQTVGTKEQESVSDFLQKALSERKLGDNLTNNLNNNNNYRREGKSHGATLRNFNQAKATPSAHSAMPESPSRLTSIVTHHQKSYSPTAEKVKPEEPYLWDPHQNSTQQYTELEDKIKNLEKRLVVKDSRQSSFQKSVSASTQ